MKLLMIILLFLQIQVIAQNGIVLCRNFPCNIANNYYSFMWNGKVFSRYSKEFLLTYEGAFFLHSEKKYFLEQKNEKLDSTIEIDDYLFSIPITINQKHKRIRLFLKSRNFLPVTSVYSLNKNALVVENFLERAIRKNKYILVDTLSSFVVKKKLGVYAAKPFENISKLYFIDSSSTTYFFNDSDSNKKDNDDFYIMQDGSEIYPFMKIYSPRSKFKLSGCTALLDELSKENLLVRPKGSSLDTTDVCSSWVAINKRMLSQDEVAFLDSLP